MLSILPAHITSTVFCFISSLLIAYQVIKRPNKLRFSILGYSIFTLPASIISTLSLEGLVSQRANSLVYLVSTLLMCITHFFMVLDVGYRLRAGDAPWKHPLVLCGIAFSACTSILLLAEIIILAINSSGTEEYPLKGAFIAGVICAIIADSCVFTYTFMPLLYWREKRVNEGHSRTTALGVSAQNSIVKTIQSNNHILDLVLFDSKLVVLLIRCSLRLVLCHELLELLQHALSIGLCSSICREPIVYLATT